MPAAARRQQRTVASVESVPFQEPGEEREPASSPRGLAPVPEITVLGTISTNNGRSNMCVVRTSYSADTLQVSPTTLKLMDKQLGMIIHDNPAEYIFQA